MLLSVCRVVAIKNKVDTSQTHQTNITLLEENSAFTDRHYGQRGKWGYSILMELLELVITHMPFVVVNKKK